MAGTGRQGAYFPVPHPQPAPCSPSQAGFPALCGDYCSEHTASGLMNQKRQRFGKPSPRRQKMVGGRGPRPIRSVADLSRQRREEGLTSPAEMRDALCCRSSAGAWSIPDLDSPQLRAPWRKPGAASHEASPGPQISGLLLAQRRGSRSNRAGRSRRAPSSRVQDKVCLVWASCDEAGSLASLLVLPGSRPWVAKAAPPPSRPLPFTVFWWLLLSATRLLWQLGGTVRA